MVFQIVILENHRLKSNAIKLRKVFFSAIGTKYL